MDAPFWLPTSQSQQPCAIARARLGERQSMRPPGRCCSKNRREGLCQPKGAPAMDSGDYRRRLLAATRASRSVTAFDGATNPSS